MHMRLVALSLILMTSVALAGCLGGDKDLDADSPIEVEAVAGLSTSIETAALGSWLAPGETIQVSAAAPANAVGNVTYTWAIQPDPFTIFSESPTIDTGNISAGGSAALTFDAPGFYEYGHCDPHPWMKHTVAVLDDHTGPDALDVYIVEGDIADKDSWAFVPEHITVKTGATVTYHNLGLIEHTASIAHKGEAVPVPKVLALDAASGTVAVEAGNGGYAKVSLFVSPKFADYMAEETGSFLFAAPAGEDPSGLNEEQVFPHKLDWKGTLTVDVTLDDPTESVNQVIVEVREVESDAVKDPETLHTTDAMGSGSFDVTVPRGVRGLPLEYEIVVRPARGAGIGYTLGLTMVYDHTPPELVKLPCPEPHYSMGHC
jgi:plastocyanin